MPIGDPENLMAYQDGRKVGMREGYDIGFSKGKTEGREEGFYDGLLEGRKEAQDEAHKNGHAEGWNKAVEEANPKILGLMQARSDLEARLKEKEAEAVAAEAKMTSMANEISAWRKAYNQLKDDNAEFGESLSRLNVMYMACAAALNTFEQANPLLLASAKSAFQDKYVSETKRRIDKHILRQPPHETVGPAGKKFLLHWLVSAMPEGEPVPAPA